MARSSGMGESMGPPPPFAPAPPVADPLEPGPPPSALPLDPWGTPPPPLDEASPTSPVEHALAKRAATRKRASREGVGRMVLVAHGSNGRACSRTIGSTLPVLPVEQRLA